MTCCRLPALTLSATAHHFLYRRTHYKELLSHCLFSLHAGVQPEMQMLVERRIYPFLLMVLILLAILSFQIRQFKRLYEHIKNDKSVELLLFPVMFELAA